jgi:predicted flavoprotein YhiN
MMMQWREMMTRVVVIGGGAGGMLAAGRAAEAGTKVVLLEKNGSLGKKLLITGKGRCNLTNTAELNDFIAAFGTNGKFLYGALTRFSNQDLIDLLLRLGVPTKVERGGRVFPMSNRAADVLAALESWIRELKVDIRVGQTAKQLVLTARIPPPLACPEPCRREGGGQGAGDESNQPTAFDKAITGVGVFGGNLRADAVILATGGITYPKTGSTGDGYRMASEVGHTVIPPAASLSALVVREPWVSELQGLSLRNVSATLYSGGKKIAKEFGEMIFTHFGVSGPIILSLSKVYARIEDKGDVIVSLNLKPSLKREQLEERLIQDFTQTRQFKNYLIELLPRSLSPVFIELSGIPSDAPVNKITAAQRKRILDLLLDIRMTVSSARAADEAIVTSGGVSIKEIDPRTMESKLVQGLYFCGEVIDIDAVTGGYNLQAAFSTGWVAGENAAVRDTGTISNTCP